MIPSPFVTSPYDGGDRIRGAIAPTEEQINRARLTVARQSKDADECKRLLDMLDLGRKEEK